MTRVAFLIIFFVNLCQVQIRRSIFALFCLFFPFFWKTQHPFAGWNTQRIPSQNRSSFSMLLHLIFQTEVNAATWNERLKRTRPQEKISSSKMGLWQNHRNNSTSRSAQSNAKSSGNSDQYFIGSVGSDSLHRIRATSVSVSASSGSTDSVSKCS